MYDTVTDSRVVERAAAGDQRAWERLVQQHSGRLRAIAGSFRLNPSDAEDAMQATWTSLVTKMDTLRSHERAGAWLATTMRRNCLRILQGQRQETPVDSLPAYVVDDAAAVEQPLLTAELAELLWRTVSRLPKRQAHLVRALFTDEERSYHEIASALSMPVGAIGPVRQRALHRLAMLLDEIDIAPDDLRLSA
jgi:RNA polymerase sigma factor (sigma-70 family)